MGRTKGERRKMGDASGEKDEVGRAEKVMGKCWNEGRLKE